MGDPSPLVVQLFPYLPALWRTLSWITSSQWSSGAPLVTARDIRAVDSLRSWIRDPLITNFSSVPIAYMATQGYPKYCNPTRLRSILARYLVFITISAMVSTLVYTFPNGYSWETDKSFLFFFFWNIFFFFFSISKRSLTDIITGQITGRCIMMLFCVMMYDKFGGEIGIRNMAPNVWRCVGDFIGVGTIYLNTYRVYL